VDENAVSVVATLFDGGEISQRDGDSGTWVYLPVSFAAVQAARIPLDDVVSDEDELRLRCYVGQAPMEVLGVRPVLQTFGVELRVMDVWTTITETHVDEDQLGDSIAKFVFVQGRTRQLMLQVGGDALSDLLDSLQATWEARLGLKVVA
jgi:hypothetical protein